MRDAVWVATLLCVFLSLLSVPAAAQPYPPSPPPESPDPDPEVEVTCEVGEEPELACEGEGYLPGSEVTVEVRDSGTVVAEIEVEVGADGTFRLRHPLPCDLGGSTIDVTVTGQDSQGQQTVDSWTLQVPATPDCDPSTPEPGGRVEGDDVQGAPDGPDGPLAFTGRNLLVLLAIALVLLLLGAGLVRARRRQGEDPA